MDASNVFLGAAAVFGTGMVLGVKTLLAKPKSAAVAEVLETENPSVPVEPRTDRTVDDFERERLEEISWLWAAKELHLAKIAILWREPEEAPEKAAKVVRPHFSRPEIDLFYDEFISGRPVVKGKRRTVIVKILQLLDVEGDCPSVVGKGEKAYAHEPEKGLGDELYEYLSQVPVWKHSLLVARKYAAKFQHDVMLPDALIIALGHDLGKLRCYYGKIYKSGDHAILSTNILNGIPEYAGLSNRNELNRVIQGHHLLVPDSRLTAQLKAADSEARAVEGEGLIAWLERREEVPSAPAAFSESTQDVMPKTGMANTSAKKSVEPPVPDAQGNLFQAEEKPARKRQTKAKDGPPPPAEPMTANVHAHEGESSKKGRHVCSEKSLPEWWDVEKLMASIKESINIIIKDNAGKPVWMAVSDNGTQMVWVDERLVWDSMKAIAANTDTDLLLADADAANRRDYLYTTIMELGRQHKVADQFMGKGFYQVPVNAITGSGKSVTMFLIPFNPDAFGETISNLEVRKGDLIRKMVTKIIPKQCEDKQCSNV